MPSLSLLSHLYLGGSWVIPASSLYPLLPPQPLLEPRKKPSAELAFSRFFFFLIPISLCSKATSNQGWCVPGLAKGWYCVSCSRRKGCPLAFLFDSIPCHSAGESEVTAAAVSCKWGPPCLRTYMLILSLGRNCRKKITNKTEKN